MAQAETRLTPLRRIIEASVTAFRPHARKHPDHSAADFALIINEYALIVSLITLNDLTSTLVGDPLIDSVEAQIVRRDADSWLIDGLTPVGDVETELELPPFPDDSQYETIAGFMMYMLRKLPRRTDSVVHGGYKFEVIDVDRNRIDQLLVTRLPENA